MTGQDISTQLQQQIIAAHDSDTPLCICGGSSKSFYGRTASGEMLSIGAHQGVINYEPTELVITARAGTPLSVIEEVLQTENQMLAFEPPHYGEGATLGGTIACNLSGPRRAYAGAARDFVLGCKVINGKGEILSFGGEVMKNVAGYDVSRLMCGAMGTLGVLLEVSLKVLPRPEAEATLVLQGTEQAAQRQMHDWSRYPLPISATCYDGDSLFVRLCGAEAAIKAAGKIIGGDPLPAEKSLWQKIREQQHAFFRSKRPLWRLSLASDTPLLGVEGKWLYEWGGALRWLVSEAPAEDIRAAAQAAGGHATLYRGNDVDEVFQPLSSSLMAIHRKLKQAFDPKGILNPGRMYPGI